MKQIKWSQWSPVEGMVRCGENDLQTLMAWMRELGKDACKCAKHRGEAHAIYGRKIYDDQGNVEEIRFYCDAYMSDDELDKFVMDHPHDVIYAVHKNGGLI